MPQDRLRSPRAGHGRKTTSLSDFEYRVWDQYQLSADDFGVMPLSPLRIKADNDAIAERPDREVEAAIQRLVDVGLTMVFDHQGKQFICDPTWQDFQKIEYPRVTILPVPPAEILGKCTIKTRQFFRKHPGGTRKGSPKRVPKVPQTGSEGAPSTRARGRAKRLTANGLRQEANGQTITDRFEQFWSSYPCKVARLRAEKAFRTLAPDGDTFTLMLSGLERQKRSRQWHRDDGEYIPHPATWLNQHRWEDERPPSKAERQAAALAADGDWFEECKRLHDLSCNGRMGHRLQMDIDAEKGKVPA